MGKYDHDFDFDAVEKTSFDAVPVGDYLCELKVPEYGPLGKKGSGSMGWRVSAKVLDGTYRNYVISDRWTLTGGAANKVNMVLGKIAGVHGGMRNTAQVREHLNGKLARVHVESIRITAGGDFTALTEEQAEEYASAGATIYRESKVAFDGYRPLSTEETAKCAALVTVDDDIPFGADLN
jgi:hypothetical protein